MSEKRKDKRGRILKTGETQDKKTGRYKYTYYDVTRQISFPTDCRSAAN